METYTLVLLRVSKFRLWMSTKNVSTVQDIDCSSSKKKRRSHANISNFFAVFLRGNVILRPDRMGLFFANFPYDKYIRLTNLFKNFR